MFVGGVGGTEPDIADDDARDVGLLSDEFKFATLSAALTDSRAVDPSPDADARRITASLDEQLHSQDRAMRLLTEKVDRLHPAAIEGERTKVRKAPKDIDLAAAPEMWALDGEIRSLRDAITTCGAKLKEDMLSVQRQAKDCLRQSQDREAQAIADVRNVAGRVGAQLRDVVEENTLLVFAVSELRRAKEQLGAEVS
jgi:hypothetical protein